MPLGEPPTRLKTDEVLQTRFRNEFMKVAPHWETAGTRQVVVNPTPLIDLTKEVVECAKNIHDLDLSALRLKVLGKLESAMPGGSIKTRAALCIIDDAIDSGRLRRGQVVFEATSGNFGIALGLVGRLGFKVFALVSRELRPGVLAELKKSGVKLVDLDIEICPAPGLMSGRGDARWGSEGDASAGRASTATLGGSESIEATIMGVRQQLALGGLDPTVFDRSVKDAERLLRRQDAIGLAKLLAKAYGGFCPEQYNNELNAKAHELLTGPEIDQQLADHYGSSLEGFELVSTFGTGGTSSGLLRYMRNTYGRGSVHVVFPQEGQDVAGIRTKVKAAGLRFYTPAEYAGQHEVDFEQAKRTLGYFVRKGYDIGESSALALFAVMQMAKAVGGGSYVIILADGMEKYQADKEGSVPFAEKRVEVEVQDAASVSREYAKVVWTHPVFSLSSEGTQLIASSLGVDASLVSIAEAGEVERFYFGDDALPPGIARLARDIGSRKLLLVCTTGSTSRKLAQLLLARGISAESLKGGIAELSRGKGADGGGTRAMSELLEPATNQRASS